MRPSAMATEEKEQPAAIPAMFALGARRRKKRAVRTHRHPETVRPTRSVVAYMMIAQK